MAEDITIKKSTYNAVLAGVFALAVAFSFVAGFVLGGSGNGNAPSAAIVQQPAAQAPSQPYPDNGGRVQLSDDGDPAIGSSSAQVTMIEFSDLQCPFCARFFEQTLGQLIRDYVDTGKVRFVYRDFPLSFHPEAEPAALAAECANEQNKFWGFHDKIFQNQDVMSDAKYKEWARELGMNSAQFDGCLDSKKYQAEVQKDIQDGSNAGVSGTPTFFIGNAQKGYQKIVGAQPYSVIKAAIEQELSS